MASHYAPRTEVILCGRTELPMREAELRASGKKVALLAEHLDERDPQAFARRLYAALREACREFQIEPTGRD